MKHSSPTSASPVPSPPTRRPPLPSPPLSSSLPPSIFLFSPPLFIISFILCTDTFSSTLRITWHQRHEYSSFTRTISYLIFIWYIHNPKQHHQHPPPQLYLLYLNLFISLPTFVLHNRGRSPFGAPKSKQVVLNLPYIVQVRLRSRYK